MILADTTLWVEHLRHRHSGLSRVLENGEVLTHPFVIGEVLCGNLRNRSKILGLLNLLPSSEIAEHDEVIRFVESRQLFGKGIGWVDAHLLAAALLSNATLWTLDKRLAKLSTQIGLAYR
jgi:predicted nucleic acid-binding protein